MDPFDGHTNRWYLPDAQHPEKYVKDGTIYIWDAHFSNYFGSKIQLNTIMQNKYFKLIKAFKPDPPFKTLGGYDYGIYVFQKINTQPDTVNYHLKARS